MESDAAAGSSITSLVNGIINDVGDLFAVELRIVKAEFKEELEQAKTTAVTLAVAAGFIGVGVLLLLQMLAQLVHVYTELPLWGCYGIVGFCSVGSGGLLWLRSKGH